MAKLNYKTGLIEEEDGDLQWETPKFVKDFFGFIIGEPEIKLPEAKKVNLLK